MKKILYSSLFLSILQSILFWHKSPGISVILFIVPTVLVILYNLKEKQMINNKKGILWAIPIILLSLTYFIFNNAFFQVLNIPVIFTLIVIMCISITEEKISENRFIRNILGKIFKPFGIMFEFISDFEMDDFLEKRKEIQNEKVEFIKKLGKSILISIPVIIIIIILLSSADSVFGNLFKDISEFISKTFSSKKISDIIWRIVCIVISFIYMMVFIITFTRKRNTETQEHNNSKRINLGDFTINTLLIFLNIIYFIFSIIQFKYLFINAGKVADFDYATYARTGFFQLMFVSFINFGLIKISKNTENEKLNKILKILLIIFTIIIVISAIFRMHLYEQEYGYTYLRLFVYFILATEILILIPILMEICGQKLDVFKISLEIIVTMYLILNFINIDYIIARNNIDRYLLDPENNTLDAYYITEATGTDAIKEKIKILNQDDSKLSYEKKEHLKNIQEIIKSNLRGYKVMYGSNYNPSLAEMNLSKNKVNKLLENVDLTSKTIDIVNNYQKECYK